MVKTSLCIKMILPNYTKQVIKLDFNNSATKYSLG